MFFQSLKFKIIILISGIMLTTAFGILLYTHTDVQRSFGKYEEEASQNILNLVELNIQAGYSQLLSDKIEILKNLDSDMKNLTKICSDVLKEYYKMHTDNFIDKQQAQKNALRWINSINLGKGEIFVFGNDGIILGHSNLNMVGFDLKTVYDMKGRKLAQSLSHNNISENGDSAVFSLSKPTDPEKKKNWAISFHFRNLNGL